MSEDQIYLPQTPFPEINVTAKRKKPRRVITSPEWSHENINAANSATEREKKVSKQVAKATRQKMDQAGTNLGSTAVEVGSSFTPLWFVAPAVKAGLNISEGNYKEATKEAATGLLAPYAIGKGIGLGMKIIPKLNPNVRTLNKLQEFTPEYFKNKKLIDLGNESRVYDNGETVLKVRHRQIQNPAKEIASNKVINKQLPDNLFLKEIPVGYIKNETGVQIIYEQPKINTNISEIPRSQWDQFAHEIEKVKPNGEVFDFDATGINNPYNTNVGLDRGKLKVFDFMYNPDLLGKTKIFLKSLFKSGGKLNYLNYINNVGRTI